MLRSNLLRGIILLLILLRIKLRLLAKAIILRGILCLLRLRLLLLSGIIPAICLLRVLLHYVALWCRVVHGSLWDCGSIFLRTHRWGTVMRRTRLSLGGVNFLAFVAEEKEDENADDGYDYGAADGAADDGADGGG